MSFNVVLIIDCLVPSAVDTPSGGLRREVIVS
jgi:hypothetical protein